MKDAQKIALFDAIMNILKDTEKPEFKPQMIGMLNRKLGINGFKTADIGTPVFDSGDRYMIILEKLDGSGCLEIKYMKNTLYQAINFI